MAALTAGVPTVNLDELTACPFRLVGQLPGKLTPASIADGFGKMPIFDHILHREAFQTDHLVLVNDLAGEFVEMVKASIGDFRVAPRHFLPGLGTIGRALLFARQVALCPCQLSRIARGMTGIIDPLVPSLVTNRSFSPRSMPTILGVIGNVAVSTLHRQLMK